MLVGAAALALLGASAAACGSSTTATGSRRTSRATRRARADSQLATDAAAEARGAIAQASTRWPPSASAHAQALSDELVRMRGKERRPHRPSRPAPPPNRPSHPTVKDVIGALRESAESAAELAAKLSGYRAGPARFDRGRLHSGIHRRAGAAGQGAMTSPSPPREPTPTTTSSGPPSPPARSGRRRRRRRAFRRDRHRARDNLRLRGRLGAFAHPTSTSWCRRRWPSIASDARRRWRCWAHGRLTPHCPQPATSCR